MNASVWIKAIIGVFVTLGTTLITLFTGPDVKAFADISQVQYAVAIIGAVLAGLGVLQASLSDSPSTKESKQEIITAAANLNTAMVPDQKGFARISFLWLALGLCAALIAACNINPPQTTRQSLLAAYASAQTAAQSIQAAKANGQIDAAQRDALLDKVKTVRDLLNATRAALTNNPAPGSSNDSAALTSLHAAQDILLAIQAALPQEKKP